MRRRGVDFVFVPLPHGPQRFHALSTMYLTLVSLSGCAAEWKCWGTVHGTLCLLLVQYTSAYAHVHALLPSFRH